MQIDGWRAGVGAFTGAAGSAVMCKQHLSWACLQKEVPLQSSMVAGVTPHWAALQAHVPLFPPRSRLDTPKSPANSNGALSCAVLPCSLGLIPGKLACISSRLIPEQERSAKAGMLNFCLGKIYPDQATAHAVGFTELICVFKSDQVNRGVKAS